MLVSLIENSLLIRKVADALASCKKIILISGVETPETQLQMEMERLALSAPHMLADIGFEREVAACGPNVDVWRKKDIRFAIQFSSTTSVSAR